MQGIIYSLCDVFSLFQIKEEYSLFLIHLLIIPNSGLHNVLYDVVKVLVELNIA